MCTVHGHNYRDLPAVGSVDTPYEYLYVYIYTRAPLTPFSDSLGSLIYIYIYKCLCLTPICAQLRRQKLRLESFDHSPQVQSSPHSMLCMYIYAHTHVCCIGTRAVHFIVAT